MQQGEVAVSNHLGLHARAAAKLVKTAGRFSSTIMLVKKDGSATANAKSILSVLSLAASRGMALVLKVEGNDEEKAFAEISALFSSGFGET